VLNQSLLKIALKNQRKQEAKTATRQEAKVTKVQI
jgi:hypothetical protein